MIRTQKHASTFSSGIDQDTSVNKVKNTFIFDSENMRIISNDPLSSGALTNVKGNSLKLIFDVDDDIKGFCKIRSSQDPSKDDIVFFTYNTTSLMSKIYLFSGDPYLSGPEIPMGQTYAANTYNGYSFSCGYIYANADLNFQWTIKAEGRYESDNLRKIYWVDGNNPIRYMILDNIDDADPVTIFDVNPSVTMVMPVVEIMAGGSYTSGLVQYSYQLYIRNGAATTFSPTSDTVALTGNDSGPDTRQYGGSDLGANTGKAVRITLNNLDTNFNRVRIIAIHYTEYLVDPTINIVGEVEYTGNHVSFIDNGYTSYGTIPIDEFRLFGQTTYYADSLASKYNYLFYANIKEDKWNPAWLDPTNPDPINNPYFDSRAVRYNWAFAAYLDDSTIAEITLQAPADPAVPADWVTAGWNTYTTTYDGINLYNNVANDATGIYDYKFQHDGTTLGAEGPNVVVGFEYDLLKINDVETFRGEYSYISQSNYIDSPIGTTRLSSQRTEVYRMYLVFYNTKMQASNPQWICDLRIPSNSDAQIVLNHDSGGSIDAQYIYPTVTLRNIPNDPELYGWQIFRCDRDATDRSVLASGVISAMDNSVSSGDWDDEARARPYSSSTIPYCFIRAEDSPASMSLEMVEMVSPEICFNKDLKFISNDYLRVDGRYNLHTTHSAYTTANSDLAISVSLSYTSPISIFDTRLIPIDDAKLQSFGVTYSSNPVIFPPDQTIGSVKYVHTLRHGAYYGNRGTSLSVKLNSGLVVAPSQPGFILGSYVRNVFSTQYGGNTYEARSYNSVIPYSDMITKYQSQVTCYRGDTHITMFSYLRSAKPNIDYAPARYQQEMVHIPCESSINCLYRLDKIQKYYDSSHEGYILQETVAQGVVLNPTNYPLDLGDLYRYNPIYSKSPNANLIQNVIFDSNNIEYSDVKIISTGKKINNEYYDNWTNVYTNNYIEVDPKYGAVHNIWNLNNKLFVGQDKGISVLAVNDRSIIQDNNKSQLTLGTGGVLERYDYLTTTSGFQNYFDMVCSYNTFYYLDRRNKVVYQFSDKGPEPISEILGYRSFLKSYGTMTNVYTGFDPIYKELFFYITDGTITKNSVFNEYTNSFNGKHTFSPDIMFNLNDQFYSIKDHNMWIHNYGNMGSFYGTISNSTVTLIINPGGVNVNRYDTLELRVDVIDTDGVTYNEDEQFNTLYVNNNYQALYKILTFDPTGLTEDTSKSLIRKWRISLIPDDDSADVLRLIDTYLKVNLSKLNTNNKKIVLHDIVTYYRNTKG